MSGEAIVIASLASSPAGIAVLGGLSGAIAVGAALDQITSYRNEQNRKAELKLNKKKQRIKEWQTFQAQQQKIIQDREKARSQTVKKIEKLTLLDSTQKETANTQVQARGFLSQAGDYVNELSALDDLIEFCDTLPELLQQDQSPVQRLKKQAQDLKARYQSASPPLSQSLNSFRETVQLTIEQQLNTFENQQQTHKKLLIESEDLLNKVITCQTLTSFSADMSGESKELLIIEQQLLQIMHRQVVTFSDLDLLSNKFSQIKLRVDTQLEQAAIHHSISQSMQKHLKDMGYQQLETDTQMHTETPATNAAETTWIIPGGEQVRVALHSDHRIAFQIQHERAIESDAELDESELNFLRQQEQKWCDDLEQLVARLVADGFQYEMNFERKIPEDSIPIVVVDELDDLTDERSTGKKNLHDKTSKVRRNL